MRRVIAALVVALLAIGVVVMWPQGAADTPPETSLPPPATTSTSQTTTTSTTDSTTTTESDSHVVTTVEEAEAILRELWFGWFEGIYNEDVDRIREVVGNPSQVEAAASQFGVMQFDNPPSQSAISITDIEILRSDVKCLAVWAQIETSFRPGDLYGVHTFIHQGTSWALLNVWKYRDDLWEGDCDTSLSPSP